MRDITGIINLDIFEADIKVYFTEDIGKTAAKFEKYNVSKLEDVDTYCGFYVFIPALQQHVIVLNISLLSYNLITHESVHAGIQILDNVGALDVDSSQETICCTIALLVSKIIALADKYNLEIKNGPNKKRKD